MIRRYLARRRRENRCSLRWILIGAGHTCMCGKPRRWPHGQHQCWFCAELYPDPAPRRRQRQRL